MTSGGRDTQLRQPCEPGAFERRLVGMVRPVVDAWSAPIAMPPASDVASAIACTICASVRPRTRPAATTAL
jgi:hypothetical protein